jgi:hypothetical protein
MESSNLGSPLILWDSVIKMIYYMGAIECFCSGFDLIIIFYVYYTPFLAC